VAQLQVTALGLHLLVIKAKTLGPTAKEAKEFVTPQRT
jgi:hypothetical protein